MKTDRQIQADVIAELAWTPSVHSEDIGVEVKDGIVTLAGHVNSYSEKIDAEHAAMKVAGVKALAVEMDVKLVGATTRNDVDIARSVEHVLQWTTFVPKDSVKIQVEGGWVTLSGEVSWEFQRQAATNAVRYLMSVRGVSNQLVIKPTLSAPAVKADIEAALKRRAQRDANTISVSVHGADVTLSGQVHSWSERELATATAWMSPGVSTVVDNITLSY